MLSLKELAVVKNPQMFKKGVFGLFVFFFWFFFFFFLVFVYLFIFYSYFLIEHMFWIFVTTAAILITI